MVDQPSLPPTLGARYLGNGRCRFLVWAPCAHSVELNLPGPPQRLLPMVPRESGYFELLAESVEPGTQYFYRIDGRQDRPDPASRLQPEGVHRASAVVDPQFAWNDQDWPGIPLHQYITYEIHVGTYTLEGSFDAVIPYLPELQDLGITALELMPVAQFPGGRNWGYDGVHPFAVQNTYGGPTGLKRLVDAAHQHGLAVVLDVVYNHIGPEGNYLAEFGHYFTDRHHTPWGKAVNFDDRHSDEVRRFFIENALYWIDEFHIDALRLDAIHAIFDSTATPFLEELADAVRAEGERQNRRVYTIAESNLNDPRLTTDKLSGGIGIDCQWSDDLHHAIWTELFDERLGYYADFDGFPDIVQAYRQGFVLDGGHSLYRGRRHGRPAPGLAPHKLVVYIQNHDQVGNRFRGERLASLVSVEQLKLAAGLIILSPYQPLLFMGEEYGEQMPFQYFISHTDPALVEAVRRGRYEEFARFKWTDDPPDPQDEMTFQTSKLNHDLKQVPAHRILREFYRRMIEIRKTSPPLAVPARERMNVATLPTARCMLVRCWAGQHELLLIFHFDPEMAEVTLRLPGRCWDKLLDSADARWNGPGGFLPERIEPAGEVQLRLPPYSLAVYRVGTTGEG